jgi:PKD repeat protein
MTRMNQRSEIFAWLRSLNYLEMAIVIAVIFGILVAAGILVFQARGERYTYLYIYPESYTNYPTGMNITFRYGVKSFEQERTDYLVKILINDRIMNTTMQVLDPGQILERNVTLDTTGTTLPAKVRVLLTSQYNTYEVHFWLKEFPPVAAFSASPTSGKEPITVRFTDLSTRDPKSWKWDFGDGTTSTLQNPEHTFSAGTFTVTLTVKNTGGSDEEIGDSIITITPKAPPVATFLAFPTMGRVPLTVNFTDQSTNSPTVRHWDFGDTITSLEQNPVHTYYRPGNFTVTLTVTNEDGTDQERRENFITVFPFSEG